MLKTKEQKAITLIALVITIIVMLILAGVTINLTWGENGIFSRAKEAKEQMEIAMIKEQIQMDILTEKLGNNGNISHDSLKEILEKYGTLSEEGELTDKTLTTKENYEIKISDIFNGTTTKNPNDDEPEEEKGVISKFKEISARNFCMAIDIEGHLWTWGSSNTSGELGNGTNVESYTPTQVMPEKKFSKISTGSNHGMAIDEEGKLWTWGNNTYGQLGNGTNTNSNVPINIRSGAKFKSIAAGQDFSLAITDDGHLYSWGRNNCAQLGDGTMNDSSSPIHYGMGFEEYDVDAGAFHSVFYGKTLATWGSCSYSVLGNNNVGNYTKNGYKYQTRPLGIMSGKSFLDVSTVSYTNLAVDTENNLWVWGYGVYTSGLGDGTTMEASTPMQLNSTTKFSKVATGQNHHMLIDTEGNLWGWGTNKWGQLGTGTNENSSVLSQITTNNKFSKVAVGGGVTMAIDEKGNLWTCGHKNYLGNDAEEDAYSLVKIVIKTRRRIINY